jgi:hypothetical protein
LRRHAGFIEIKSQNSPLPADKKAARLLVDGRIVPESVGTADTVAYVVMN